MMDVYEPDSSEKAKPKRISAIAIFTWVLLGCIGAAFLAPLAGLRLRSASEYLSTSSGDAAPIPTLQSAEPLSEMWVNVWFLPEKTYVTMDQLAAESVTRGTTPDGKMAYRLSYTDGGFNTEMGYWFQQLVQSKFPELDQPLIDVLPGRVLAWIEMPWGGVRNRVCMIYELNETGTEFDFKGILVGSQMLTADEGSFFDQHGSFVEDLANRAVREMVMIDASGTELTIQQIAFTQDRVDVLAVAK